MLLNAILAVDKNNLIGNGNKMPWYISNDFKYFKSVTSGKIVIMGRNTFDSIGKALPERLNIVLTSDKDFNPAGVMVMHSIEELTAWIKEYDKVPRDNENNLFVIGGANLINQLFDNIRTFHITHIDAEFEGDTYTSIDFNSLNKISEVLVDDDKTVDFNYSFVTYSN